ncbi:hypothetical protein GE21DRAFT_1308287 [Neurospora crassa]|nr:hypothetical protein GE21DRAFT_1308287 [Neurospora crassa]
MDFGNGPYLYLCGITSSREARSALFAPVCADRASDRDPKKPLPAATGPGLGSHVIGSPGTASEAAWVALAIVHITPAPASSS